MEPKQNKSKVISNQSLILLNSKIQTSINTNQQSNQPMLFRNDAKNHQPKAIRFNTLAAESDDVKIFSKSQFNRQKPTTKKLSKCAMSTQSSFVKSKSLSKHEQSPSRYKLRSAHNLKPRRLKTNPEENERQRESLTKIQKCFSCKKIKDLIDQEKNKDTIRVIQSKLSGKSQKRWQQKYLKKRIQNYSKISQTIKQVTQLLYLQSQSKIKNILNDDEVEDITQAIQKQLQTENDQNNSQSQDSSPNHYHRLLNQKSSSELQLLNPQQQKLKRKFSFIENKRRKKLSKNQSHFLHNTRSGFLNNNTQSQSLKKNQISSLNISEHFNTGLSSICTKQTKELKLQREAIYSNFTKHKAYSINTLCQFQTKIFEGKKNNKNGEESLIHELRQRRTAEKLAKEPKQWHLHNLTGLNKMELYQTKLNVSAESWVLMDCLEMKYLRGCKVKKLSDKTLITLRLGLFKCFQNISKNKSIDLKKIRVRVNYHSIENKIIFITNKKITVKNRKLMEEGYTLRNNTVISIEGLLIGLCRIQGCWDIIFWLIQFCGYLQQKVNEMNDVPEETLYDEVIYFKDGTSLDLYESVFFNRFMKIVEELQLQSTKISIGYIRCPKIQCNLIDLGILFLSCIKYPPFYNICFNQISNDVPIKYQVGWNHWENRVHSWKNSFHKLNKLATFGWLQQHFYQTSIDYVQNLKEQDVLIYQPHQKTLILVNAAKVNLGVSDVMIIDEWSMKTFKRFYKETKGSFKYCQGVDIQRQKNQFKPK